MVWMFMLGAMKRKTPQRFYVLRKNYDLMRACAAADMGYGDEGRLRIPEIAAETTIHCFTFLGDHILPTSVTL